MDLFLTLDLFKMFTMYGILLADPRGSGETTLGLAPIPRLGNPGGYNPSQPIRGKFRILGTNLLLPVKSFASQMVSHTLPV